MFQATEISEFINDDPSAGDVLPLWIIKPDGEALENLGLSDQQKAWLKSSGWKAEAGKFSLVPSADGSLAGGVYVYDFDKDNPLKFGALARKLPVGKFAIKGDLEKPELEVLSWVLSLYKFERYKSKKDEDIVSLSLPDGVDRERLIMLAESVFLGRDLINVPSNDMGPEELEDAALQVAKRYGADVTVVRGDDLLTENYPLIHAVGRASVRAPRLVDFSWGDESHPTLTLVGKGICFDTGGLNLKPGGYMTLMKKDMGGAATVISLANMIMASKLPVRLRVIICIAENSVAGNAFRPGDVLPSRNGMTVEIVNTDAEGRLVLADGLALADQDKPDHIMTFATLTGAARAALGADIPPFYSTDDDFAELLQATSIEVGDPVWRMPFWQPYESQLKSSVADVCHVSESGFAGSITAGLFLKKFVKQAGHYTHLDIYGWCQSNKAGKSKGGDPQSARAVFEVLEQKFAR